MLLFPRTACATEAYGNFERLIAGWREGLQPSVGSHLLFRARYGPGFFATKRMSHLLDLVVRQKKRPTA
jgi:hypothetical protein